LWAIATEDRAGAKFDFKLRNSSETQRFSCGFGFALDHSYYYRSSTRLSEKVVGHWKIQNGSQFKSHSQSKFLGATVDHNQQPVVPFRLFQ
jgi:hypothetical protein